MRRISWLAEKLTASQEGLCSMDVRLIRGHRTGTGGNLRKHGNTDTVPAALQPPYTLVTPPLRDMRLRVVWQKFTLTSQQKSMHVCNIPEDCNVQGHRHKNLKYGGLKSFVLPSERNAVFRRIWFRECTRWDSRL